MEDESVNTSMDTGLLDDTTEDDGTPTLVPSTLSSDWVTQMDQEQAIDNAAGNFDKDLETIPRGTGQADIAATSTPRSDDQAEAFLQNVGEAWRSKQADPSLIVHVKSPSKDWTTVQPSQELKPKGNSEKWLYLPLH